MSANKKLRGDDAEEDMMEVGIEDLSKKEDEMMSSPLVTVPDLPQPYMELPPTQPKEDWAWAYNMRRSMQEIIPGLFLGPYAVAVRTNLQALQETGITHIVCVRHFVEKAVIRANHPQHFQYLVVDMADDLDTLLIPHLRRTNVFINNALASGGKVLVHGNAGISRSASIVIAFIMAVYGVSYIKAFRFVQSKRLSASPSEWFIMQLKEFEVLYQAMHDVPQPPLPGPGDTTVPSLKRHYIEDED